MKDWTGSKASVFKTIGASNHTEHDRQREDYYATEPAATEWLTRLEHFDGPILEPSCGEGHISRALIAAGYEVESRDLIDRGYGTGGCDFLAIDNLAWDGDIVTNPPYKYAQEFVEKALAIIPTGRKVAMFLKLTFCEGKARKALFQNCPPPTHLGQQQPSEVRYERRLRRNARLVRSLRLVRLAERMAWRSCH